MQTPPDQYIKVGNINTRFWELGDQGTTVILLHGLGGSIGNWLLNITALAQHHQVYAVDMPGFGYSDRPLVLFTCLYGAQFISNFMEIKHIERANLIGNSMGSSVALALAIQYPEKVEKLVLANSWGLGKEVPFITRLLALPIIGELLSRPSHKGALLTLKGMIHNQALITDELVERFYQSTVLPGRQGYFLSTLRGNNNFRGQRSEIRRSIVNNLATITTPTLILWGRQDRHLPVAHAYFAQEKIPNTELHIFSNCGHLPQYECHEEFNSLVLEFLAR